MTVTVQLFAAVRERGGGDCLRLELPPGATVADLRAELARRVPELAGLLARSAVAVNQDFADDDQPVTAADELAIIPPVSGG
jgi:molybdopterin converting factor subunit 1